MKYWIVVYQVPSLVISERYGALTIVASSACAAMEEAHTHLERDDEVIAVIPAPED